MASTRVVQKAMTASAYCQMYLARPANTTAGTANRSWVIDCGGGGVKKMKNRGQTGRGRKVGGELKIVVEEGEGWVGWEGFKKKREREAARDRYAKYEETQENEG